MIDKPLYQNPLGGGQQEQQEPFDLSKRNKNPYNSEFIGIGEDQTNLFGYKVPDYVIKEQEERMKNNPINMFNMTPLGELGELLLSDPQGSDQLNADQEFLKTADEYQKGFRGSEFYKPNAPMTADIAEFIYKSPTGEDITMKGSSSGIGQFGKYLGSIGKGDLLQRAGGSFSQDLLKANPNDPYDLGSAERGVSPIYSGDNSIASVNGVGQDVTGNNPMEIPVPSIPNPIQGTGLDGAPVNSYNRVGQQLMGPNQDEMLGTLKNIEGGIASLVGNYGQNFNTKQSSNNGNFNNFGVGDFFPPYGGMYD